MADSYLGMPGNHTGKTFDKFLELVPSDSSITTGTTSTVVEVGTGLIDADLVLDVTEVTGDNTVAIQLSADAAFTTPVVFATATIPAVAGRIIFPFRNVGGNEKPYGFVRLSYTVGGTLKMGAFIAKK